MTLQGDIKRRRVFAWGNCYNIANALAKDVSIGSDCCVTSRLASPFHECVHRQKIANALTFCVAPCCVGSSDRVANFAYADKTNSCDRYMLYPLPNTCSLIALPITSASLTGAAFPMTLYIATTSLVVVSMNTKSSGNVWMRATSRTVNRRFSVGWIIPQFSGCAEAVIVPTISFLPKRR